MRYSQFNRIVAVTAVITGVACVTALAQTQTPTPRPARTQARTQAQPTTPSYSGIGSAPTQEDLGALAWTTGPSGRDLPPGSGTATQGARLYLARCSMCHGPAGEGVRWQPGTFSAIHGPRLAGGNGVPTWDRQPGLVTTIAYTSPFPAVLFNTIAVEMPVFQAGTLTPDQTYALTAWILFKNGIIKEDEVMNSETLPKVQMPNRKAFPASDDAYLDMNKRGCYKTYGVCLGN